MMQYRGFGYENISKINCFAFLLWTELDFKIFVLGKTDLVINENRP